MNSDSIESVLGAAGIPDKVVLELRDSLSEVRKLSAKKVNLIPNLVCAGIYNAGKSTLLNAVIGEEVFTTGDIPTTKEISAYETPEMVYVDTPGLNANADDDETALRGYYENADLILFVSSAPNGGVSLAESDWLQKIQKLFGERFSDRLVFVLSKSGQAGEAGLDRIVEKYKSDLRSVLGFTPERFYVTDARTWFNGKAQNEPLLVQFGNIDALRDGIQKLAVKTCQSLRKDAEDDFARVKRQAVNALDRCRKICADGKEKLGSGQNAELAALRSEAEQKVQKTIASVLKQFHSTDVPSSPEHHYKSKSRSTVRDKAKTALKNYATDWYNNGTKAMRAEYNEKMNHYAVEGMGSYYYIKNERVNTILEETYITLVERGLQVTKPSLIEVHPTSLSLKWIKDALGELLETGDKFLTPKECVDSFNDCIEYSEQTYGYTVKGLFGQEVWKPYYLAEIFSALSKVWDYYFHSFSHIAISLESRVESNLKTFDNTLHEAVSKALDKLFAEAQDLAAKAAERSRVPYDRALRLLSDLEKEVKSCRI